MKCVAGCRERHIIVSVLVIMRWRPAFCADLPLALGYYVQNCGIECARIGDKRTPAGRYTNHSASPNAKFVPTRDGLNLVATRRITGMTGGRVGEEITIDYRQALELRKQLCHRPSQQ